METTKQNDELIIISHVTDVEMMLQNDDHCTDFSCNTKSCIKNYKDSTDDYTNDLSSIIGAVQKIQVDDKIKRHRSYIFQVIGLFIVTIVGISILYLFRRIEFAKDNVVLDAKTQEQAFCFNLYPRPPPLPGKKGVALRMSDTDGTAVQNLPIMQSLRPYWNYAWHLPRSTIQPDDIEYVPMLWGSANIDEAKRRIDTHVIPHIKSGKVKRIFGYNEPDEELQANMPVESALDIWSVLEYANVPLVSPSCAQPSKEWMVSFMNNATSTCKRIDWVGVHWYGPANIASFKYMMRKYYLMHGKRKLIISEFAVAKFNITSNAENPNTPEQVLLFMKQALPWIESQPWIVGYAWFPFRRDDPRGWSSALFNNAGTLTQLGKYYASVRTETPNGNYTIRIWNGWNGN